MQLMTITSQMLRRLKHPRTSLNAERLLQIDGSVQHAPCDQSLPYAMLQAGSGKTSLFEGRSGTAIDDSSSSTPSQEGLMQLIGTSLFDLLEDKQVTTGLSLCSSTPAQIVHHTIDQTLMLAASITSLALHQA